MKRLMTAVALTALLIPAAVSAQERRAPRDFRPRDGQGQLLQAAPQAPRAPAAAGQGRGDRGDARADRGDRGGGQGQNFNRGDRGQGQGANRGDRAQGQGQGFDRGGRQGRDQQAAAQAQARAQAQAQAAQARQGQAGRGARNNDGNRWNGQNIGQAGNRFAGADNRRDGRNDANRFDNRNDNRWDNRAGRNDGRTNDNRWRNAGGNQWQRGWYDTRRISSNRGSYLRWRSSPFRWPSGYSYRRWSVNQFLPTIFLSSSYFIGDFYDIGLPYPPPGTDWVRVGNDALLVDIYSGEILDVVPDVFYW